MHSKQKETSRFYNKKHPGEYFIRCCGVVRYSLKNETWEDFSRRFIRTHLYPAHHLTAFGPESAHTFIGYNKEGKPFFCLFLLGKDARSYEIV